MKPTKVLFHGFSDHGKTGWILRFRDKYLGMSDVNVLSVEFHAMARTPWYTTAAKLTRYFTTEPINSSINVQFRKVPFLQKGRRGNSRDVGGRGRATRSDSFNRGQPGGSRGCLSWPPHGWTDPKIDGPRSSRADFSRDHSQQQVR